MGFELYPATLERNHHPQVNLVNQSILRNAQGDILLRGEGGQEVCGAKGIS